MQFCVHNGTSVSVKFDTLTSALSHAVAHDYTLVFFIAGSELCELRYRAGKWEVEYISSLQTGRGTGGSIELYDARGERV
jgi:hypothetical protein